MAIAFAWRKLPFLRNWGWFCGAKSPSLRWRKPQNAFERFIFQTFFFHRKFPHFYKRGWLLPRWKIQLEELCFSRHFSLVGLYKQLTDGKDITFIATNDWEWQSARTKSSVRFSAIGIWGIHRLYSIAFLLTSASLMREKRRPSYMDFAASFSLIQYKNT